MPVEKPWAMIPHKLGTVTSGNELSTRPASHLGEFSESSLVWQSSGNANLWVRGDFGTAKPIDHISLILVNAQPGTQFRLRLGDSQAQVDGAAPYDSGVLTLIDGGYVADDGLYTSFHDLPALQTRRWWRIDITGHTGDFIASALALGTKRVFANFYNADNGLKFADEDMSDIEFGRTGIVSEAEGVRYRFATLTFGWMSKQDRLEKFEPLVKALGNRGVALWRVDPQADVWRQRNSYFGWLKALPYFTANNFCLEKYEAEFQIRSMI